MVKITFFILLVSFLVSCHAPVKNYLLVTAVAGVDVDKGTSGYCANFYLTKKQAQQYFLEAKAVSIETIHDDYEVLPCFVYGYGELKNEQCQWQIRAGGTGHVNCANDSFLTGCKNCLP